MRLWLLVYVVSCNSHRTLATVAVIAVAVRRVQLPSFHMDGASWIGEDSCRASSSGRENLGLHVSGIIAELRGHFSRSNGDVDVEAGLSLRHREAVGDRTTDATGSTRATDGPRGGWRTRVVSETVTRPAESPSVD